MEETGNRPYRQGVLFSDAITQYAAASRKVETRMEAADEPRRLDDPLRDAIECAREELDGLKSERYRMEARLSEIADQIKKREDFIRVALALSKDAPVHEISALPDPPTAPAFPSEASRLELTAAIALRGLPREGYGAITQAVVRLLNHYPPGLSVPILATLLHRQGFVIKGESHETAVRSALKNLRKRSIASYDDERGRYVINHAAAS